MFAFLEKIFDAESDGILAEDTYDSIYSVDKNFEEDAWCGDGDNWEHDGTVWDEENMSDSGYFEKNW